MRHALTACALAVLLGCGKNAVTPTAPPTPVPFPAMTGGWGGTASETWTSAGVQGSRTCNETWLITSQTDGAFSGAFQATPGSLADCAVSGIVNGSVMRDGTIEIHETVIGLSGGTCVALPPGTDTALRGVLSPAGNITAGVIYQQLRCSFPSTTIDYRFVHAITLSRR